MKHIVNVFTPYFLCNHFIGDEAWQWGILPKLSGKNDLNSTNNIDEIQEYDIVQCQFKFFSHFVENILPKINKKIVLITSQFEKQCGFNRDELSDIVLAHPNIVLWISTNPVYTSSGKFMAFPCGLAPFNLSIYANTLLNTPIIKDTEYTHMHLSSTHECRELLPKGKKCYEEEFYNNIKRSKFMISPIGDRDDCYRHYECIGLQTIPISNVNEFHQPLYNNNMYICDIPTMNEIIEKNKVNHIYEPPNQDLICVEYYKNIIMERIALLQQQ